MALRWYRGQDSAGTQRQDWCSFDLYPDPAEVVAIASRLGRGDWISALLRHKTTL
jgi:hypothetical protein